MVALARRYGLLETKVKVDCGRAGACEARNAAIHRNVIAQHFCPLVSSQLHG
jgi:hypothetical protein